MNPPAPVTSTVICFRTSMGRRTVTSRCRTSFLGLGESTARLLRHPRIVGHDDTQPLRAIDLVRRILTAALLPPLLSIGEGNPMGQQEHDGEGRTPGAGADGPVRLAGSTSFGCSVSRDPRRARLVHVGHRAPDHVLVARSRLLHAGRLPLGRWAVAARGVLATLVGRSSCRTSPGGSSWPCLPDLGVRQGLRIRGSVVLPLPGSVGWRRRVPTLHGVLVLLCLRRRRALPATRPGPPGCRGHGPAHSLRSSRATSSRHSLFDHRWPWCRASPAPCSSSSAMQLRRVRPRLRRPGWTRCRPRAGRCRPDGAAFIRDARDQVRRLRDSCAERGSRLSPERWHDPGCRAGDPRYSPPVPRSSSRPSPRAPP